MSVPIWIGTSYNAGVVGAGAATWVGMAMAPAREYWDSMKAVVVVW